MSKTLSLEGMAREQNDRIAEAVSREQARLKNFIRSRVPDERDAEDILQDVFYELVEAYRMMKPIERVGAWLYRVARNRITDLFRKRRPDATAGDPAAIREDGELLLLEDRLPSADAGPEAAYARAVLIEELDAALDELPEGQREAFVAHEIEGRSFKEVAQRTGLSVNTLVLRKHYAVVHLRERLEAIYEEFEKDVRTRI
ncbi:MAG TPA: sigma-70 family RNA polymerase sigma factor [Candidatus Acidoferrales bacterium]|nr:sigma-70 family RNA polymerase sigma factor [Candidatus Acidoferrales bacterium]